MPMQRLDATSAPARVPFWAAILAIALTPSFAQAQAPRGPCVAGNARHDPRPSSGAPHASPKAPLQASRSTTQRAPRTKAADVREQAKRAGYEALVRYFRDSEPSAPGGGHAGQYAHDWQRIQDARAELTNPDKLSAIVRGEGARELRRALPDSAAHFAALRPALLQSREGREALALQKRYRVRVLFGPWHDTFYNPRTNTIVLGLSAGPFLVDAFIHEMNHATFTNEGRSADPLLVARDVYVDELLREEAAGEAHVAEAYRDQRRIERGRPVLETTRIYREAYALAAREGRVGRLRASP
jgi:hypothetical protein